MHLPELPLFRVDEVYHIGTLDPAHLGRNSGTSSLEGRCLSVSQCPHAWQEIARLGGYRLHRLHREGAAFVDMLAVHGSDLEAVVAWARSESLVVDRALWKAWVEDAETDEWTWMLHGSVEDAVAHADGYGEAESAEDIPGPDGRPGIEQVTVPVGTELLSRLVGRSLREDEDATDEALLAYAMTMSGADGAWWHERHDPAALSAPRGGIFPERLPGWTASEIGWDEVEDFEAPSPAP